MLKQVSFVGFDARPELADWFRDRLADVEAEVGRLAGAVEVTFELKQAATARPFVWLTLSLTLPDRSASDSSVCAVEDVSEPRAFRRWVRRVWSGVLDKVMSRRADELSRDLVPAQGG